MSTKMPLESFASVTEEGTAGRHVRNRLITLIALLAHFYLEVSQAGRITRISRKTYCFGDAGTILYRHVGGSS